MKVLIIGSGGREHALTWKLTQSPKVSSVFVAPGNGGTSQIATNVTLSSVKEIIEWTKKNSVDLVLIGPDDYLAKGIVDELQILNIPVFGPTKDASEIEWSKSFAKKFMQKENIPTAQFKTFTDIHRAKEYIQNKPYPLVIKANGLALGKGVMIISSLQEAELALDKIMRDKIFGEAGSKVIIEEYLEGVEISIHAFCDGDTAIVFPASQDNKRIFENNKGPNTGGMGTIAPVPNITRVQLREIEEKIILPTLFGLKNMGRPFKGILFPGIMITEDGPKVIEFNARFGDPETQSYMRILETDLIDILLSCINGTLNKQKVKWLDKYANCIVLASGGYPGRYKEEKNIYGLDNIVDNDVEIFHAGTIFKRTDLLTNGGRVLGVTAVGDSLQKSLFKSYKAVEEVSFDGMYFRKDIGDKSVD